MQVILKYHDNDSFLPEDAAYTAYAEAYNNLEAVNKEILRVNRLEQLQP